MSWYRPNFYDGTRYTADQLYAARQVMARYIEAASNGTTSCLLPSPGYQHPDIEHIIEEMDAEWDKEQCNRGKQYHSRVGFCNLPLLAQYAMVEEIERTLHTKPSLRDIYP